MLAIQRGKSAMRIQYAQSRRPYRFSSPFEGKPFAILLYGVDEAVAPEEQGQLCTDIIEQGCRYAVCAGANCEIWHDCFDEADCARNDWEANVSNFVMTSWHEKESLEDVVFFLLNNTSFDSVEADCCMVLVVGEDPNALETIRREVARQCKANAPESESPVKSAPRGGRSR